MKPLDEIVKENKEADKVKSGNTGIKYEFQTDRPIYDMDELWGVIMDAYPELGITKPREVDK